MRNDEKPLPTWKRRWRESASRRREALAAFKTLVGTLVTLAVSVLGATLVALGVYSIYAPAGLIVGGVLVWALQWSHEKDRSKTT